MKPVFLFLLVLAACTQKPEVLHTVGKYTITDIDCGQRELVVRVLYPERKNLNGCEELKTFYQNISDKNMTITQEMLTQFETQLEAKFTKDKRDKVKKIFGPDKESYQKLYVVIEAIS